MVCVGDLTRSVGGHRMVEGLMMESRDTNRMFPDSRMPTELEREELCRMLYYALLEIRGLGYFGKAQQAADLADAFHNLPVYLWSEQFSLGFFREFLESYHLKYPDRTEVFNYLAMLDKITKEEA